MGALLRRILPFLTLVVIGVVVYDAWIFYSRSQRSQQIEQKRADQESEDAQRALDRMGGTDLKILNFYAAPGVIERGKTARICYSVVNAKSVRIDPPVKQLYPALTYCWDVAPKSTTEYKLSADDGAGHSKTSNLVIQVKP